jgi:hypothetical protein
MDFVKIEESGKRLFEQFPVIKRVGKRLYQSVMYTASDKRRSIGDVQRITPLDGREYFFGYYDQSPWNVSQTMILCLRTECTYKQAAPDSPAEIVSLDTVSGTVRKLTETRAWNVQQGCMLQWLGPDYADRFIYNDFRKGQYCSVVFSLTKNQDIRIYPLPVYAVDPLGRFALSLDFSRLHRLRKGYGYANLPDATASEFCPDKPCIWKLDLATGEVIPLLNYTDFAAFEPKSTMRNAEHKINHLMINPSGSRFMVLHRWFSHKRKYTRLVTVNSDGSGLYNLSDEDFTSHCCWKDDQEILSFLHRNGLNGYYLLRDRTQEYRHMWSELKTDGHCTFSPDRRQVITDTYPNNKRMVSLYLLENNAVIKLAALFSPFRYDNDTRCDLHPRWNRTGDEICFDSVHEGRRGLYSIAIPSNDTHGGSCDGQ